VGAWSDLGTLVNLQFKAKGFSFRSRQPVHSLLSGRRASRIRGRGLDFEEMRAYLPGDDSRTIDWRATARLGEPHIRVFTEERDRPAILAVDQRINMFFGSRRSTKSVTAAEGSALSAWRVFQQGDRIGAVVFDDESVTEIAPHRSRRNVMRILEATLDKNRKLSASSSSVSSPAMLNRVLERLSRIAAHDHLIAVFSDFNGADSETRRHLLQLSTHNDVVLVLVLDPIAREIPVEEAIVASNGELQVELHFGEQHVRRKLQDASSERVAAILNWQKELGIPVLVLRTSEDVPDQIRRLLGEAVAGRRRS
jgi:uncharacterized protein (DUF58 family)